MVNVAVHTGRVVFCIGSSAVATRSTRSEVRPTPASVAVTLQTSPSLTGPVQTMSVAALKNTFWSASTARAATTHAAMSIHDIIQPPCITPSEFVFMGITSIDSV